MVLDICQAGEPVLRQVGRRLSVEEIRSPPFQQLVEEMRETMRAAPGVGLAAPQVGLSLQLAVIEDRIEYQKDLPEEQLVERGRSPIPFHVIINPVLTPGGGQRAEFFEGCLSVTGFAALVPRATSVKVECLNERAEPVVIEARGWYARILQHEIDHLNGIIYIDRMHSRSFMTQENLLRHWARMTTAQVREEFG